MIEKLCSGGSVIWISCQAQRDKQLEVAAPALVDWWHAFFQNVLYNRLVILQMKVWRSSICQLHCEDTKSPNVNFGVIITFALEYFWSHPEISSTLCCPVWSLLRQLHCKSEIRQFNFSCLFVQNVVGLYISMNDVLAVQIRQCL